MVHSFYSNKKNKELKILHMQWKAGKKIKNKEKRVINRKHKMIHVSSNTLVFIIYSNRPYLLLKYGVY